MNNYIDFVRQTTSDPSLDYAMMATRLAELEAGGTNTSQLLTAALGLTAESGEFTEVVKKMVFQGKPWSDSNREHLIIELGDVLWYVAQACMALGVDFEEVLEINVKKLEKRYPTGSFDIYKSENRASDDR